jgi:hypothetical protein
MAGRFLHIFELGAIFERRGDEGGAHRVCGVAAIEPEASGELAHHAVDGVGVHSAAGVPALAIGAQRPEPRAVEVGAVVGEIEIGAQPRRGLRIDGERVAPAALTILLATADEVIQWGRGTRIAHIITNAAMHTRSQLGVKTGLPLRRSYDVPLNPLTGMGARGAKYAVNDGSDWSQGTPSKLGQLPHDGAMGLDGNLYYTVNNPNPDVTLGRVDTKTGEVKY